MNRTVVLWNRLMEEARHDLEQCVKSDRVHVVKSACQSVCDNKKLTDNPYWSDEDPTDVVERQNSLLWCLCHGCFTALKLIDSEQRVGPGKVGK